MSAGPEYKSVHRISRQVFRTIEITFSEIVTFNVPGSRYGNRKPSTGTIEGFRYHDTQELDQEPEPGGHNYTMLGVLHRADGKVAARSDYRWTSEARRFMNLWIADNPDWWKP